MVKRQAQKSKAQHPKREVLILAALLSGLAACVPVTPLPPAPTFPAFPSLSPSPSPVPPAAASPTSALNGAGGPSPTPLPSPTITISPTPDCSAGTLESRTIPTTHLASDLRFLVYLPPCYEIHADARYPVLYLFHGLFYDESQWVRVGAISAADTLITSGEISPLIIVLPYDPSGKEPDQYGFSEAIIADLLPYMDNHYRTLADSAHRAAGGLSRGGGWAVHFGLSRPDLFGAFGAHSPGLFQCDHPFYDDWLRAIPPDSLPRIWIDIGENDRELASVRAFEVFLNDNDVPHEWHLNQGYHDEAYWRAHVEQYLRWYAAGWKP